MLLFRNSLLFAVLCIILVSLVPKVESSIRFTNLRCLVKDNSWVVVNECRLRAKSREVVTLNFDYDLLRVIRTVFINFAIFKKENGYKPFLYNITVDACDYLKRLNNPVLHLAFKPLRDYSTFNHSCPYTGNQKIVDFSLKNSHMTLPFPSGEYGFFFKCFFSEKKVSFKETNEITETQAYFEYVE